MSEVLEKAYKIAAWKDDPETEEGRERYLKALEVFRRLFEHPWFRELKSPIKILDLCSGKGIGGVALSKVFIEKGFEVKLVMVDIRRDAVEYSKVFASGEGIDAEAYVMNALEAHKLGLFDIVLIYGASLAHFDEWSMIKLMASASSSLKREGVIVLEEMDRVDVIFRRGFKEFIVENRDPSNLSISLHTRYDYLTGSYYRTFIRLRDFESINIPINFRSIAHIASVLWLFTEDIDIIPEEDQLYLILGKKPRQAIKPSDLKKPRVLRVKAFKG